MRAAQLPYLCGKYATWQVPDENKFATMNKMRRYKGLIQFADLYCHTHLFTVRVSIGWNGIRSELSKEIAIDTKCLWVSCRRRSTHLATSIFGILLVQRARSQTFSINATYSFVSRYVRNQLLLPHARNRPHYTYLFSEIIFFNLHSQDLVDNIDSWPNSCRLCVFVLKDNKIISLLQF